MIPEGTGLRLVLSITVLLGTLASPVGATLPVTQIIDSTGDGTNSLDIPRRLAVDKFLNVYVVGEDTDNAFRITSDEIIAQIIDADVDNDGTNDLDQPRGVVVDEQSHDGEFQLGMGLTPIHAERAELK